MITIDPPDVIGRKQLFLKYLDPLPIATNASTVTTTDTETFTTSESATVTATTTTTATAEPPPHKGSKGSKAPQVRAWESGWEMVGKMTPTLPNGT